MAKKDVNAVISNYEDDSGNGFTYIRNCSKSKAYDIKHKVDLIMNPKNRFCEVKYDEKTKTARFEIVS